MFGNQMGNSIFSESLFAPCFEISIIQYTHLPQHFKYNIKHLEFHLKHSHIFTPKFDSFLYKNLFSLKMKRGSYFLKPRKKFCTLARLSEEDKSTFRILFGDIKCLITLTAIVIVNWFYLRNDLNTT